MKAELTSSLDQICAAHVVGQADVADRLEAARQQPRALALLAVELADDHRRDRVAHDVARADVVPPHSTMQENRRSSPTISAIRSWISPLPSETKFRDLPGGGERLQRGAVERRLDGDEREVELALEVVGASRPPRAGPCAPPPPPRTSGPGRAGARRAPRWCRARRRAGPRPRACAAVMPPMAPPPTTRMSASVIARAPPRAPRSWCGRSARALARRALERRVVRDARGQERAEREDHRERDQPAVGRAGGVLHEPDQVRADEAAEVADRVDQRDPGRRRRAAQQRGRHRPEHRVRAEQEEQADGQRRDRERRARRSWRSRTPTAATPAGSPSAACARPCGRSGGRSARGRRSPRCTGSRSRSPCRRRSSPSIWSTISRDPERDAVDVDDHAEVQDPNASTRRSFITSPSEWRSRVEPHLLLALEALGQPALLVLLEPLRVLRAVVEVEEHEDAREHRRDRLDQEQPLPVLEARRRRRTPT